MTKLETGKRPKHDNLSLSTDHMITKNDDWGINDNKRFNGVTGAHSISIYSIIDNINCNLIPYFNQ